MKISRRGFIKLLLSLLGAGSLASFIVPLLQGHRMRVRFSTTTSLYATGLLDYLASAYTRVARDVSIDFVPVGSGAALRIASENSVDGVFVHAPNLEIVYIKRGVLTHHKIIAYNYFCIVGPREDPADVRDAATAVDAFRRIWRAGEEGRALFVSRGDDSGTYIRERIIWQLAGLQPNPSRQRWYLETGQGMAGTLLVANNIKAYTLSDTGTFYKLKLEGRLPRLTLLYTSDPILINIYSAYIVKPRLVLPSGREALRFIDFIVEHPELIKEFKGGVNRSLFEAAAADTLPWLEEAWRAIAYGEWGRLYDIVPRRDD